MKTLSDYDFNGESALVELLTNSVYGSVEQAIASLTLFSHPTTVSQTQNKGLFRIRRYREGEKRGQVVKGERVLLCDNNSPTNTFLWANGINKKSVSEVQFNHIYQRSDDPDLYTSLANLCVTPAFLSKLTDKSQRVKNLLQFRAFDLYGFAPFGEPPEPECYKGLLWAKELPACPNLRACIERHLAKSPKSRITLSVQCFGWGYEPMDEPDATSSPD